MTLKVSVGFKAWLGTTDDRRPLSDYRTVLEGTIIQIAQLEVENERCLTLQDRIFKWGRKTFGAGQRQEGVFAHLVREIKELGKSIPESDPVELADCTILLLELAGYAEVDLLEEVEKKFAVNQQRKWGPIQADGSILHIEEKPSEVSK